MSKPTTPPRAKRLRGLVTMALAAFLLLAPAGLAQAAPGDLDPSFDGDGKNTIDHLGSDHAESVLLQPDRKIILAGYGGATADFTVTRLHPDGAFDDGFSAFGTFKVNFGGADYGRAAALQADGKIVVAGFTPVNNDIEVTRLNRDGSLDTSFDPGGADGAGKKAFGYGGYDYATAVLVQPDGKIVLAGFGGSDTALAVTRLNPNGSFDTSFDGDGTAGVDFGDLEQGWAVALQADGKLVVVGHTYVNDDIAVARLNANGSLDDTFNSTGKLAFGYGGDDYARAVTVQPDGRILIAGYGGPDMDLKVARLNPDGSFDPGFDGDGATGVNFGSRDTGHAIALQANGKILVAGGTEASGGDVAVARLQPGGAPDTTFGSDGKATVDLGGADYANAVALQANGRIVLAGHTSAGDNVAVARLEGDPTAAGGGPAGGGTAGGGTGRGSGGASGVPLCAGKRATIVGTPRRDRLRGTQRADVIVALGGGDVVTAARGNDLVCGGAGNDTLAGGPGRDRLLGGAGRDRLTGGSGRDRCLGGGPRDRVRCETGRGV